MCCAAASTYYLRTRAEVQFFALYLEGLGNPRNFLRIASGLTAYAPADIPTPLCRSPKINERFFDGTGPP